MSNTRSILRCGVLLAATLVPVTARAQNQGTWVLTPYAGVYLPANNLARFTEDLGGVSAAFTMKHNNAFTLGGTANYWFAERVALEFGGAYAYSHVGGSFQAGGVSGSEGDNAYVAMGTTKLMYAFLPTSGDAQVRFGIGPAVIRRGGSAYKEEEGLKVKGLTNLGAAMSLCTRIPLAGRLALRLRAEDYMYQARLKFRDSSDPDFNFNTDRRFQNDFILSAGLQIGLNR